MLATAIVVFREVLEASLIVGLVMAASVGVRGRTTWVVSGGLAGLAGAGLVAAFAAAIAEGFSGAGQELLNAAVLGLAVIMLGWHNVWMARHSRQLAAQARALGQDVLVGHKPMAALAMITGAAILREGSETVLF